MVPLLQLHSCVHIQHKLKLQAVIERHQVKAGISGFVINNFYIDMIPAGIHPVNPAQEFHFLLL